MARPGIVLSPEEEVEKSMALEDIRQADQYARGWRAEAADRAGVSLALISQIYHGRHTNMQVLRVMRAVTKELSSGKLPGSQLPDYTKPVQRHNAEMRRAEMIFLQRVKDLERIKVDILQALEEFNRAYYRGEDEVAQLQGKYPDIYEHLMSGLNSLDDSKAKSIISQLEKLFLS